MKKEKKDQAEIKKVQTQEDIKNDMPVKNAMTDGVKNSATNSSGLNQEKTTRDDLFPSDGDNLTNG